MDWLTFIAGLVKALAWPAVVIAMGVVLRRQVATVLVHLGQRLTSIKGGGMEASFGKEIDKAESNLAPTISEGGIDSLGITEVDNQEKSNLPPAFRIIKSWQLIERALQPFIEANFPSPERTNALAPRTQRIRMQHFDRLVTDGILKPEEANGLQELRYLRNRAAHDITTEISLTDVLRYEAIARAVVARLDAISLKDGASS